MLSPFSFRSNWTVLLATVLGIIINLGIILVVGLMTIIALMSKTTHHIEITNH
jgi:uncharacterized membrane protein YedE/YeeE